MFKKTTSLTVATVCLAAFFHSAIAADSHLSPVSIKAVHSLTNDVSQQECEKIISSYNVEQDAQGHLAHTINITDFYKIFNIKVISDNQISNKQNLNFVLAKSEISLNGKNISLPTYGITIITKNNDSLSGTGVLINQYCSADINFNIKLNK